MALFYFDFCQRDEIIEDHCGLVFKDTETAYLEAHEAATAMWGELLRGRQDPRRCAFRVRDAQGNVLFVFQFREVLESCRDNGWLCSPVPGAYRDALQIVSRTRQLSVDFQRELDKTQKVLREARQLIATPLP